MNVTALHNKGDGLGLTLNARHNLIVNAVGVNTGLPADSCHLNSDADSDLNHGRIQKFTANGQFISIVMDSTGTDPRSLSKNREPTAEKPV